MTPGPTASMSRLLALVLLAASTGAYGVATEPQSRAALQQESREIRAELERRAQGLKSTGGLLEGVPTDELIEKLQVVQKSIYGDDDRREIAEAPAEAKMNARAVAAVLPSASLQRVQGGWRLSPQTRTLAAANGLCAGERFGKQPAPARCTAFLTRPDVVLTAGHCVTEAGLADILFVFGFEERRLDRPFPPSAVFAGKRVVARRYERAGEDWAVVQLDRPVPGIAPLDHDAGTDIAPRATVYAIGCPAGLPLKYAGAAEVWRSDPAEPYFVASLDTFAGNSGSPVFSGATHHVVGILVRGADDFVRRDSGCSVAMRCSQSTCQGEDVMRLARIPAGLWR